MLSVGGTVSGSGVWESPFAFFLFRRWGSRPPPSDKRLDWTPGIAMPMPGDRNIEEYSRLGDMPGMRKGLKAIGPLVVTVGSDCSGKEPVPGLSEGAESC
ncbi:hypothetical protein FKM82_024625 [Ascaphus truei]